MNNLRLLDECIANPEPFLDPYYSKVGSGTVISKDPKKPTNLQRANFLIKENITALSAARRHGAKDLESKLIHEIMHSLKTEGINNTEFTSFWEVNDISFSIYNTLSAEEQHFFVSDMITKYIEHRHGLYQTYGYTDVTLQVKADSFAHKRSGNQANEKVQAILQEFEIDTSPVSNLNQYMKAKSSVLFPDKQHEGIFDSLMANLGSPCSWGSKHEGKRPDFVVKFKNRHLVIEHKHMKEFGGGQNKQISEIIDLISYDDSKLGISYVAFMDGILFNRLLSGKADKKGLTQRNGIRSNLTKCPENYFVNTYGFRKILGH